MFRIWLLRVSVALAMLLPGTPAQGHFLGGKWLKLELTVCNAGLFAADMAAAAAAWNHYRGLWPRLVTEGCAEDDADIRLQEYYDPNDYAYALAVNAPAGGPYAQATIYVNSAPMRLLRSADRVGVFAHEVGHVLGLGHNCTNSIMASGDNCPFRHYEIKGHDRDDLDQLYGSGG